MTYTAPQAYLPPYATSSATAPYAVIGDAVAVDLGLRDRTPIPGIISSGRSGSYMYQIPEQQIAGLPQGRRLILAAGTSEALAAARGRMTREQVESLVRRGVEMVFREAQMRGHAVTQMVGPANVSLTGPQGLEHLRRNGLDPAAVQQYGQMIDGIMKSEAARRSIPYVSMFDHQDALSQAAQQGKLYDAVRSLLPQAQVPTVTQTAMPPLYRPTPSVFHPPMMPGPQMNPMTPGYSFVPYQPQISGFSPPSLMAGGLLGLLAGRALFGGQGRTTTVYAPPPIQTVTAPPVNIYNTQTVNPQTVIVRPPHHRPPHQHPPVAAPVQQTPVFSRQPVTTVPPVVRPSVAPPVQQQTRPPVFTRQPTTAHAAPPLPPAQVQPVSLRPVQ